jgi:hypothetical protein
MRERMVELLPPPLTTYTDFVIKLFALSTREERLEFLFLAHNSLSF